MLEWLIKEPRDPLISLSLVASCVPHSLLFSVSAGNQTELRSSCLQGKRFTKCELFPQTYLCFLSAITEFILMST